jgi:hypothetical protein
MGTIVRMATTVLSAPASARFYPAIQVEWLDPSRLGMAGFSPSSGAAMSG